VTFGYDPAQPVLNAINLSIAPGEMVGFVGRSGSGKSTLVSLISRLYEVGSGQLLIDGRDVRSIPPRQLRRQIGMVPQDPFLFRGSVSANITYGNPEATAEQTILAARNADAHDFIMRMPLAYDAQLGEGGSGLSGGERQRLSIARAILFDPAILILDEATASVDAESERAICEAIRRWAAKRTTILIAHRLSTLQDADRLFVFDQGRLVEQGTHEKLIGHGGLYQKLAELQGNLGGPRRGRGTDHDSHGDHRSAWLDPADGTIADEGDGLLRVAAWGRSWPEVFAVRAFPAANDYRYISLRYREPSGGQRELGMIRSLAAWPRSARAAVERSLGRRYLFHAIDGIRQIRSEGNQVVLQVTTEGVRQKVHVDLRGNTFHRFGQNGLLLFDAQGGCYVIADRDGLPKRQRNLLELYFGD
jgi:ABC-type multidrug transport system ATPase subunit